jgi:adenosylmethionine-8-amino-7-oxononanoate aminotransferase
MKRTVNAQPSALLKQEIDASYPCVVRGEGVFLFDEEGRRYLDGASGAMTASVGHGVAEIAEAIHAQAERLAFSYRTQFTNPAAEALANRLTALAPGHLNSAFFVSSGSEAAEFAIRAAVGYWQQKGHPSKAKVLSREISYHGMTMGALSMSGHPGRRPDYGPLLHPFPVASPAYAYRCALPGETTWQYAQRAVSEFEAAIVAEGVDTVAAIIVEPIVGAAGGALVAPEGYFRLLRQMSDRLGVLLIADEIITGIGRTGDWFACSAEEFEPDLLLLGKGLSGGYAPVAGVLLSDHVVETFRVGSGVAPFGHTFSNNPLGAATSLAVLDYIAGNEVLQNVRARGRQLEAGLRALADRFDHVADVRGRGLLWGFEFVMDQTSKLPPRPEWNASKTFTELCFRRGLIVYPAGIAPLNNAVIISPPLTITEAEMVELLELLAGAMQEMERHLYALGREGVQPPVRNQPASTTSREAVPIALTATTAVS